MPVALSPIVPPLTSSGSAPVTGTTSDGSRPYALIRDQANFDITADNWDTYRNATILYEVLSRQVITRGSITIAAGLAEEGDRVSISNVRGIDRLDVVFSGDETVDGQDDFIILQGEYFEFIYTGNNLWREVRRPFAEVWARINNTTPIPDDKILPNYNAGDDDVTIDNDTWPNYRNGILRTSAQDVSIAGDVANDGDRLTIQKVGTSLLTITIDDSDTIEGDATFETLDEGTYDFIFHQGNWELLRETDAEVIDTIAAQPGQILTVDDEQTAVTASAIEVTQEDDVNVACISTKSSEIWSQGQSETLTATSALDREFAHSAPSTSDLAGFGLKADTNVEGLKIRIRSAVANGQVSRISTLPDNLDDNQENIYGLAFVGDRFIAMGINRLYDVDENAGAITRVADVTRFGGSSFFVPVDMEHHNGVLYGLRSPNNGTTNLFILNPDTSVASQVQNSDQFLANIFAESIASFNGDFYVAGDTHLYRVDLDTFQRTQIGNYRLASGQDGVSINLFPRAITGTPDGLLIVTGGSNALSRIDHETGELTFIQNLNVAGGVEAITYKDGAIYVSARDEQNIAGSNTPVITARIYAGHLSDVGFFPSEAIYNDADARGRKAVPVGADITVPADRKTRLVRSHSYNVDVRWSRGTLRHQGQVLALAIQSFTDGPKKLATQNDIEVLDSIEDFALTTSASQVARSKLMAVEPFAFEDEDAQLPVAKLPSSIPTTRLPRYNRFLGTIGASGADFNNFPAANRNELVQAIENPGTVNGVELESHYFYRAIRDTSNDQGQNWERVEVPESSTDNANASQPADILQMSLNPTGTRFAEFEIPDNTIESRFMFENIRAQTSGPIDLLMQLRGLTHTQGAATTYATSYLYAGQQVRSQSGSTNIDTDISSTSHGNNAVVIANDMFHFGTAGLSGIFRIYGDRSNGDRPNGSGVLGYVGSGGWPANQVTSFYTSVITNVTHVRFYMSSNNFQAGRIYYHRTVRP